MPTGPTWGDIVMQELKRLGVLIGAKEEV